MLFQVEEPVVARPLSYRNEPSACRRAIALEVNARVEAPICCAHALLLPRHALGVSVVVIITTRVVLPAMDAF
jgi:hypothetical protein